MSPPFVPAKKEIAEITARSVILGILLGIVLTAANAYLGLYAGMTVSASIPAAVLSMGILRGLFRTGTILENNIVQTIASSGESLAAGILFTVPALMLTGVWSDIAFWPTVLICLSGGLLGIVFMVPLRKSHIVEATDLTYPEGRACAEVLIAGERSSGEIRPVLYSVLAGGAFKFFTQGIALFKGTLERTVTLRDFPLYLGTEVSAALIAVGYIVSWEIGLAVVLGGITSWWIAVPYLGLPDQADLIPAFWRVWNAQVRYLGVGAMITAGLWSIIQVRKEMLKGILEAWKGFRNRSSEDSVPRTEKNIKSRHLLLLLLTGAFFTFLLCYSLHPRLLFAVGMTLLILVLSFFFVAVASYLVGLLGSSNSPVSGMILLALLIVGTLLSVFGVAGEKGILLTLGVAGVLCCAACSAGDISQDLKTGYLVGATPRHQQWMEVVGLAIPAILMPLLLKLLHQSYGIGTGQPGSLMAPQANLMTSVAKALFNRGELPWNLVAVGATLGIIVIVVDQVLSTRKTAFHLPVMAYAVGLYLPLTLTVPILLGGLVRYWVKDPSDSSRGVLVASGLIAGESLAGVALAILILKNRTLLPIYTVQSSFPSLLALLALLGGLAWASSSGSKKKS